MFIAFYKDKTRVFRLNLKYIIFNLHLIIPVNMIVPVSACSVTHDGCSFFRIEWNKQQLITGPATVPGPHQGKGILSINGKNVLAIHCFKYNGHVTCSDSHYWFCSSPLRIIHLEQSSVTLAVLQSQGETLGNGVALHRCTLYSISSSKDKTHQY